jgi:hypothetical protein
MFLRHRRRSTPAPPTGRAELAYTIRRATEADGAHLRDLAMLDHGRAPAGAALVAELDGDIVAALDLRTHRAIADPFRPSAEAVELLRLRAAQLVSADAYSRTSPPAIAPVPRGAPHH